jgi:hypothetical protein
MHIDPNDGKGIMKWENPNVNFRNLRKSEKEVSQLHDLPDGQIFVAIYDLRPVV